MITIRILYPTQVAVPDGFHETPVLPGPVRAAMAPPLYCGLVIGE